MDVRNIQRAEESANLSLVFRELWEVNRAWREAAENGTCCPQC